MTVAVCVNCGFIKHGAFTQCSACGHLPQSAINQLYSLVMTDHYFSHEDLNGISAAMLGGKPRPSLPPEQEEQFRKMLAANGKMMSRIAEMPFRQPARKAAGRDDSEA